MMLRGKRILVVLNNCFFGPDQARYIRDQILEMGFRVQVVLVNNPISTEDIRLFDLDKLTKVEYSTLKAEIEKLKPVEAHA